ncbi:hypothetical protein [Pelagibius sp. Alg239-R121]|uniref:hypothetical protein n=1 Tax=Pelagibius sp. Alg239-R121 TaxID=2993448 RepID=UPI0024A6C2A8|nr:hypothetical protein [Pelagibius sp. Alg239-R121]
MSTIDDQLDLCQNLAGLLAAVAEPGALGDQMPSSSKLMAIMVVGEHLETLIEQVRKDLDEQEDAARKAKAATETQEKDAA